MMMTEEKTESDAADAGRVALTEALGIGFRLLRWALWALLAAYAASGFFVVRQHERAVALVWGKPAGAGAAQWLEPGLHWTWPRPIAEVVRAPVGRVQTLETFSFWPRETPAAGEPVGYALTGDANLIHARWILRYTLSDPGACLFGFGDYVRPLRDELDRAILRATARMPVDAALRSGVEELRAAVDAELRRRCDALGLGVRVQGVDLVAATPPRPVAAAFDSVIEAEQGRGRNISTARGYAARQANEASGRAAQLLSEARTYGSRLVSETGADADYFQKILAEYRRAPESVRRTLLQDTLRRALAGVEQKYIVTDGNRAGRELRLMISPSARKPFTPKTEASTQNP